MPTIQCALQLLRPADETETHRHTSTIIYHVFRGTGTTQIGERRFDWQRGDSFVVPLWYHHRHLNRSSAEDAILFSMSDAPVLKALDLYREALTFEPEPKDEAKLRLKIAELERLQAAAQR